MRACSSSGCRQGRAPCPCPDACRISEPDPARGWHLATFWIAYIAVVLAVLGSPFFLSN